MSAQTGLALKEIPDSPKYPFRLSTKPSTKPRSVPEDVLKPYKKTLDRWLSPDVLRNQDTSVAKAKQAISSYRKAIGEPAGLAELMVFFCERAAGFCYEFDNQDEDYLHALVNMFEQAIKVSRQLSADDRDALIARLDRGGASATTWATALAMPWTRCLTIISAPDPHL
jgi:hypothetical protein